ncbi:MAG: hypothetical protein HHAS10_09080 [Candidatus Altimarinota bacterium]
MNIHKIKSETPNDFSPFTRKNSSEYSLCGTFRTLHFIYIVEPKPLAFLLLEGCPDFPLIEYEHASVPFGEYREYRTKDDLVKIILCLYTFYIKGV